MYTDMHAKSLQSCWLLRLHGSALASLVHGILQGMYWKRAAISFSSSSRPDWTHVSDVSHWQEDSLPLASQEAPNVQNKSY